MKYYKIYVANSFKKHLQIIFQVRPISHQAVFNTNAYIMLYELEHAAFPAKTQNSVVSSSSTASPSSTCASGKAKATVTVNDGSANTNIGAANCYSNANNSITAGSSSGAIAVHYSNKSQQQDCNSDGAHDKSNNKSSSILNRNRLQLNGSRVYRSERSAPNLDPVATTSAPYGHNGTSAASSSAGNGGNAGNNGLPRHCHVRKVNGGTTLFSSSSSTSSSSDSDSEQQQRQKTQDRQQVNFDSYRFIISSNRSAAGINFGSIVFPALYK